MILWYLRPWRIRYLAPPRNIFQDAQDGAWIVAASNRMI